MELINIKRQIYILACGILGMLMFVLIVQALEPIHNFLIGQDYVRWTFGLGGQFWSFFWLLLDLLSVFGGFAFGANLGEHWFDLLVEANFPMFYAFTGKLLRPGYAGVQYGSKFSPQSLIEEEILLTDGQHLMFQQTFAMDLHKRHIFSEPHKKPAVRRVRTSSISTPNKPKRRSSTKTTLTTARKRITQK